MDLKVDGGDEKLLLASFFFSSKNAILVFYPILKQKSI